MSSCNEQRKCSNTKIKAREGNDGWNSIIRTDVLLFAVGFYLLLVINFPVEEVLGLLSVEGGVVVLMKRHVRWRVSIN